MAQQSDRQHSDPVVAAIERVLKVERDGVAALRQSESEAQLLLAETRAQATAIGKRVSACISRLHAAYLRKLEHDIEVVASSSLSDRAAPEHAYDHATLVTAARRVAARLTEES